MLRKYVFAPILLAVALFSSPAQATTCSSYTYTLTNGYPANATEVMDNFDSIRNCANTYLAPLASPQFSGSVGIGTAPSAPLHIASNSGQLERLAGTNDTNYVYAQFNTSASSALGYVGVEGSTAGTVFANSLAYATFLVSGASGKALQLGTAGIARMTIDSSGNVGIGMTTPNKTLDIVDGSANTPAIQFSYSGAPTTYNNTITTGGFGAGTQYMRFALKVGITTATPLTLLNSGNVGIGTTSPGQTLDVVGTIRQTGCTTAGTLSANTSGDIICTSDGRLKNVLGNYDGGLGVLARITPKLFTYKPTTSNPVETFVHAGFIAQEVMAVIPQASARQHDGYYSLDTTAILAAAVNAIKELKQSNDRQAAQIANLKARLAVLEGRTGVRAAANDHGPRLALTSK